VYWYEVKGNPVRVLEYSAAKAIPNAMAANRTLSFHPRSGTLAAK
jgi:hypothetical protein